MAVPEAVAADDVAAARGASPPGIEVVALGVVAEDVALDRVVVGRVRELVLAAGTLAGKDEPAAVAVDDVVDDDAAVAVGIEMNAVVRVVVDDVVDDARIGG